METYVNERTKAIGIRLNNRDIARITAGHFATESNPNRVTLSQRQTTRLKTKTKGDNIRYFITLSQRDHEILLLRGYFTDVVTIGDENYALAIQW